MSSLAVLGLGSNRAFKAMESGAVLEAALTALETILGGLRRASVYKTDPLYVRDQRPFLNTAAAGLYGGSPRELLIALQGLEGRYGRDRSREVRWGERTLDIDILLFGERVVSEPDLEIPHPRLRERRFALTPLLELVPDAADPLTGTSYRVILEALPDQGVQVFTLPERKAIISPDGYQYRRRS